jgi:hypothetical protein
LESVEILNLKLRKSHFIIPTLFPMGIKCKDSSEENEFLEPLNPRILEAFSGMGYLNL